MIIQNLKLKIKNFPKGVSLPLAIGLVTLLMVSSMAISELIIRNMQSIRRIESSNRAYLVAEAGIEDALYELSPHLAGYETSSVRSTDFQDDLGGRSDWKNEWGIVSRSGLNTWPAEPAKFYANQKLVLSLFRDKNNTLITNEGAINETALAEDIETLDVHTDFSIIFNIPKEIFDDDNNGTPEFPILRIDNDQDFNGDLNGTVNEDGPGTGSQKSNPGCLENPEDADCDGRVNEDSNEDPVILWKLSDGGSRSLSPLRGCLSDSENIAPNYEARSEICEKDFTLSSNLPYVLGNYAVSLNETVSGANEVGQVETIGDFITRTISDDPQSQLHFEFLIIAPLEQINGLVKKIEIPYIGYQVSSNASDQIPFPYFEIKSDGYYGTFKQSLTTYVTPRTTVPLFDFTIIQQR